MSEEFGGAPIFNGPSPSSDPGIVSRIVADYIEPALARPRRVLDVGGTPNGFRALASLPDKTELVLVNPSGSAEYTDVEAIPDTEQFDFAMLFGVLMYFDQTDARRKLTKIRRLLRGSHPKLLVAEPDPVTLAGFPDAVLKFTIGSLARSVQTQSFQRFHIYAQSDAQRLLLESGFSLIEQREDLNPKLFSVLPRLPVYYVLAASF